MVSSHRERDRGVGDGTDTLIADGCAVRIAAQVLQHLGKLTQRCFVRRRQRRHELAPEESGQ